MKAIRFHARLYTVALVACALAACSTLGLAPAKTFNEQVAYAAATITSVNQSATVALDAHAIGSQEAANIRTMTNAARELIHAADTVYDAGDLKTAQAKMTALQGLLNQLQQYLATHPITPKPAAPAVF